MWVSEIFHSIQGEGKTIGKPTVFVRLRGCNLKCLFCDSKFTWTEGKEMSILEIKEEIQKYNCKRIVITGGEPLLQQKDVFDLIFSISKYDIEIETNGTILPEYNLPKIQYNVSPKLTNSGNDLEKSIQEKSLQFFSEHKNSIFKFVVSTKEDLDEILKLITKFNIEKEKVYLMPEGVEEDKLKEKEQWLIEICKNYQFNYSPRLQISVWGNVRAK